MFRAPRWISLFAIALVSLTLAACDDGDASSVEESDLLDTTTTSDTSTVDTNETRDTAEPQDTVEPDAADTTVADVTDTADDAVDAVDADTTDTTLADTADTTDTADTAQDMVDMDVVVEPCGDGMVDTAAGETCDTGIAAGPGACPTSCPSTDTCQPRMLTGSECTAECIDDAPITACIDDDGCCASTCDGLDNDCMVESTSFRLSTITLHDPQLWVEVGACTDLTAAASSLINQSMNEDSSGNGYLDLSFVIDFQPLDMTATTARNLGFGGGNCTAPAATTECFPNSAFPLEQTTYLNGPAAGATTCLDVLPNTADNTINLVSPTTPCFSTQDIDISIDFAGVTVPLTYARVGARYATAPGTLDEGLMYGFIDEPTAESVVFPQNVQFIGGRTLASLLGGGTGSCQQTRDSRDTLPDGTTGWWFYLNFTAGEVEYTP